MLSSTHQIKVFPFNLPPIVPALIREKPFQAYRSNRQSRRIYNINQLLYKNRNTITAPTTDPINLSTLHRYDAPYESDHGPNSSVSSHQTCYPATKSQYSMIRPPPILINNEQPELANEYKINQIYKLFFTWTEEY